MKTISVLILGAVLAFGCVPPPITQTQHRIYDEHGKYKGRVDVEGRIFNEHGKYKGRIDSNGRIYDEHGRYEGAFK
jgi:hypothetical protein